MNLSEQQLDSLTELINIAFARSASSLSDLTGQRISLNVPEVQVCAIHHLGSILGHFVQGEVTTVQQFFTGGVAGHALLLLNQDGARLLVDLLTGEKTATDRLDASAMEVLTEVGNILLNACLGTFGNLLKMHISFSVPHLQLDALDGLIRTLVMADGEIRYALFVYTTFTVQDSSVSGYLVLVLGVTSLEKLIEAVDRLG
jgi:chemotaxis protein CheC